MKGIIAGISLGQLLPSVDIPAAPGLTWDYIHRPYDIVGDRPLSGLGRIDGTIELRHLTTNGPVSTWSGGPDAITALKFSPEGSRLATGDSRARLKLWDVANRRELALFGLGGSVASLAFSRDGRWLAAGCWPAGKSDIAIVDVHAQRMLKKLRSPSSTITTVAFSPDGRLVAGAGMDDSAVYIWDLESGTRHPPLLGHVTGMVEVTFSPDGKTLATGGYDNVRLWNVATEQEILNLPGLGTFRGLAFSPDGQTLAAAYLTYPGHRVYLHRAPYDSKTRSAGIEQRANLRRAM